MALEVAVTLSHAILILGREYERVLYLEVRFEAPGSMLMYPQARFFPTAGSEFRDGSPSTAHCSEKVIMGGHLVELG